MISAPLLIWAEPHATASRMDALPLQYLWPATAQPLLATDAFSLRAYQSCLPSTDFHFESQTVERISRTANFDPPRWMVSADTLPTHPMCRECITAHPDRTG